MSAHVLLVQLDDLELRQQQLGQRDGLASDVEPLGESAANGTSRSAHEHLELAIPRLVPEDQPPVSVARVERLLAGVPELGQQRDDPSLAAAPARPGRCRPAQDAAAPAGPRRAAETRHSPATLSSSPRSVACATTRCASSSMPARVCSPAIVNESVSASAPCAVVYPIGLAGLARSTSPSALIRSSVSTPTRRVLRAARSPRVVSRSDSRCRG